MKLERNNLMKKWTPSSMGKKGGKKSASKRLGGKTKQEISEIMRKIRKGLRKGGIVDEQLVKNLIVWMRGAGILAIGFFMPLYSVR